MVRLVCCKVHNTHEIVQLAGVFTNVCKVSFTGQARRRDAGTKNQPEMLGPRTSPNVGWSRRRTPARLQAVESNGLVFYTE